MTTKLSHRLTLRDRLSRLTFTQACKLLGEEGRKLIQRGGTWEIDLEDQVGAVQGWPKSTRHPRHYLLERLGYR